MHVFRAIVTMWSIMQHTVEIPGLMRRQVMWWPLTRTEGSTSLCSLFGILDCISWFVFVTNSCNGSVDAVDYVIAKNRYNTHGDTIVPFAATHAIELRSKEQRNIIKIKNTIVLMHTCNKQHLTYLFKLWRCRGCEVVSAEAARMYFVSEYQSLQFKVHIYSIYSNIPEQYK